MEKVRFENGVVDIPNDLYHSSHGISRSALMKFKKSPYHYWYEYLSGEAVRGEPTPALIMGEAVHTLVMEPHLYHERFLVQPKIDRRTNAGKAEYEQFMLQAVGKQVLTADNLAQATAMAASVHSNSTAHGLFQDSLIERSIYFTHSTGIQCKARPDAWNDTLVVDLKTTMDAGMRGFQQSAYKFGYYLQAGLIAEALASIGIVMEKFVFVAVEKEPPYAIGIYVLDDDGIAFGIAQFDQLMQNLAQCEYAGTWPDYGIQVLNVPKYAAYDSLLEIEE